MQHFDADRRDAVGQPKQFDGSHDLVETPKGRFDAVIGHDDVLSEFGKRLCRLDRFEGRNARLPPNDDDRVQNTAG